MKHKIYIVDAFTNQLFHGNQAAVLIMDKWPSDLWMQNVAMENQFSETAFLVQNGNEFRIRWFTPSVEVDLCGHATLAACYVMWMENYTKDENIILNSNSGILTVTQSSNYITIDFPESKTVKIEFWDKNLMLGLFGFMPVEIWEGQDQILLFETEEIIKKLLPNFELMKKQKTNRGWIAISPSKEKNYDYAFRFFAPNLGINEDPATGSAQCSISNFWFQKFHQTLTRSHQLSKRGASFQTELKGNRVKISGEAKLYLTGEIEGE